MKRTNKNQFRRAKKKQSKVVTISLIISGILMTGLVTWIAMNDWDVEKSFEKIISTTDEAVEIPEEEPKSDEEPSVEAPKIDVTEDPTIRVDAGGYIEGQELPSEPTIIEGILVANKKYPLPSTFALGEDEEARDAFNKLAAKAALSEFNLTAFSTYRSFDYQTELYERYVNRDGKEAADRYSARPGYSEHQTGLAFDIGEVNFEQHWASSTFGKTEAGKWVADNAHHFGFVMRYPIGKEEVTGYMHESWHFRYVGIDIATEIYKEKGTLEEYLGI